MDICAGCKEVSVQTDNHNGEEQLVCTSCGMVQERGSFCNAQIQQETSYVSQNFMFANQSVPAPIQHQAITYKCKGFKLGCRKILELSSAFHLSSVMREEVKILFSKSMENEEIIHWRYQKKNALVGCCLYVILRQHNWPITISMICNVLGCCRSELSCVYFKLLKLLNITIATPSVEELMETFLLECKGIIETEKDFLLSRSLDILKVAKDIWLTAGRTPRPIMVAVIYLSWQSINFARRTVSLNEFCRKMGLTVQKMCNSRFKELSNALCLIARKIPWFESNHVTPKNLHKYLEEILKYSEILLQDFTPDTQEFRLESKNTKMRIEEEVNIRLDFSDEEIDSYIRSAKEVEFILKVEKEASEVLSLAK